ncbi:MAG: GGDEF domain-containing protein [Oscillospiraceae bacterium]|nr:GGDEF domain-containing protein [Oscillospiraceae bacterium]
MAVLKEMIQLSYLSIVGNVTLLIFMAFNSVLVGKRRLAFYVGALIALAMMICNIVVYTWRGTGEHIGAIWIANIVAYSISGPVILPFVFLTGVIKKRLLILLTSFAGCNMLLCMTTYFHGLVFTINAEGNLAFGSLSTLPFILTALYLSVLLVASAMKFRLGFHGEGLFILILSLCIVVATILNTFYGYKFLISGMAVLSCIFYYLFYTAQIFSRDALTRALNRHSFYKDIENMKKRQMFLISMDLNGLKEINDTRGHNEGDKAIIAVSECAFAVLPIRYRFYRMGGDEFEILCPGAEEKEIENIVKRLKDAVARKGYSVAIGYGEYNKDMNFDSVFTAVDAMMYEDKVLMKTQNGGRVR